MREYLFEAILAHLRASVWGPGRVAEVLVPSLLMGAAGVACVPGIALAGARGTFVPLACALAAVALTAAVFLLVLRHRLRRISALEKKVQEARKAMLALFPEIREKLGGLAYAEGPGAPLAFLSALDENWQTADVFLSVRSEPAFTLFDTPVLVFLDGRLIGKGTTRRGVECGVPTTSGSHLLRVLVQEWQSGKQLQRYLVVRLGRGMAHEVVITAHHRDTVFSEIEAAAVGPHTPPQATPPPGPLP
jgi:hypothetical protein